LFLNGNMWGIGLFWLAVTGCKLNLMCVFDGALQEELAVHRLTGRLSVSLWQRVDEWRWVTAKDDIQTWTQALSRCVPNIMCLVWQTDTTLELWLPVTSQRGCHDYHVVLRHCVLCAVRAEAEKRFLMWKDGVRRDNWAATVEGAECDSLVCYENNDQGDEGTGSYAWILRQQVKYMAGECVRVCVRACFL
jgi:hypothetical protein